MLEFLHKSGWKKSAADIEKLAFALALNQMLNTRLSRNVTSYDLDDLGKLKKVVEKGTSCTTEVKLGRHISIDEIV